MTSQNFYYIIPAILAEAGKPQKALLYGLITSLARKDGMCTATNDFLAKKLGKKHQGTISQLLTQLEKEGWIKTKIDQKKGNKRTIKLVIGLTKNRMTSYEKSYDPSYEKSYDPSYMKSNIRKSNIKSINIAPASGAEVIPDLLKDKKKHIQIIGYFALAKSVKFESVKHQRTFIKRHTRAAAELVCYDIEKIKNVMRWLFKNTTIKWTLETVGKYIDEDLNRLRADKNKIIICQ